MIAWVVWHIGNSGNLHPGMIEHHMSSPDVRHSGAIIPRCPHLCVRDPSCAALGESRGEQLRHRRASPKSPDHINRYPPDPYRDALGRWINSESRGGVLFGFRISCLFGSDYCNDARRGLYCFIGSGFGPSPVPSPTSKCLIGQMWSQRNCSSGLCTIVCALVLTA